MKKNNKKSLAIMQPYLFPYIGYFSLVENVNEFVFYDDVNFIKRGWINRNKIVLNNNEYLFTVPLKKASQSKLIKNIEIFDIKLFKKQFIKKLESSYSKSKFYDFGLNYINDVLDFPSKYISELAIYSILKILKFLKIETNISVSSIDCPNKKRISGSDRIIDIARSKKCDLYINNIGGYGIYNAEYFRKNDLELKFFGIKDNAQQYCHLSIIHLLMNYELEEINSMLKYFSIIK